MELKDFFKLTPKEKELKKLELTKQKIILDTVRALRMELEEKEALIKTIIDNLEARLK